MFKSGVVQGLAVFSICKCPKILNAICLLTWYYVQTASLHNAMKCSKPIARDMYIFRIAQIVLEYAPQ